MRRLWSRFASGAAFGGYGTRSPRAAPDTIRNVLHVTPSNRFSCRLQNSRFASPPGPGLTVGTLLHLDAEPAWIRLISVNDRPEPWTIDAASIVPTADVGNGFDPVGPDGGIGDGPWRPVTFAAGGRDSQPVLLGESAPQTGLTVPGTGPDGIPVQVLSDWIPVQALRRCNGGFGWLLQVRTFSHGSMRFAASVGQPDPAIGRLHRGFWAAGDVTRRRDSPSTRADTMFACHGVQYLSPDLGATVIGIGDSIIASSCTTGEMSGFGVRACSMLSRPEFPVSYVNEGFPGRNSLGFCTAGTWAVETLRPQVAIVAPWRRTARRHGCAPILTTTAPVFQDYPEADAVRRAANERVRAAGRHGVPVLDLDALWGTGTTPNAYQPGLDAGDRTHPNDRACAIAAAVLAPMLRSLLGL